MGDPNAAVVIIANSAYFGRYDIIPASFAFLAFFLLRYQKEKLSALMLGIAVMYKYLAAVFLLPLLVTIKKNKKRIEYLLIFSSVIVLILIPVYFIASIDRFIEDTVYYFSERSARGLGVWKLISRLKINTGPSNTRFIIQMICLVIITVFMISKRELFDNDEAWIELFIVVFYVTYLLSNKIVLMQYFIFYLPFLALITSRNEINIPTQITVYALNFTTFLLLLLKNEYIDNILLLTIGVITVYIATILPLILIYKLLIKTKNVKKKPDITNQQSS